MTVDMRACAWVRVFPALSGLAILVAGCGGNASSQDIASGDDFHLPRAEFTHILSQLPPVPGNNTPAAQKEVLNRLIDEKLLANAAIEGGLDRQNDTMLQIEAARRSALARAYLMKITQTAPAPTDAEISGYYAANPDAFANRKQVSFEQVRFSGEPSAVAKYRDMLAQDDAALPGLIASAQTDNVVVASSALDKSSDQLPPATASRLRTASVGDSFLNAGDGWAELVTIRAITAAPMNQEQARPLIREILVNQRRDEMAKAEVKRLRDQAQVRVLDPQLAR
ncbi:MAG: peptidyl-prolyl cis-trans isomerase [Sphingomonadaceae bacterium]